MSTAQQILALLCQKHHKDLFLPEMKDGPTWGASHRRLDAWVLRRSWSPLSTIGYEIKRSRQDFLSDHKWPEYLGMCHEFAFVAPAGLIDPREVPEGVGLLCVSKTGTRLYTKIKPPRREIDLPVEMLIYALMSRVIPDEGRRETREERAEMWRRWARDKEELWALGGDVGQRIGTIRLEVIKSANERLNLLKDALHRCGINYTTSADDMIKRIRETQGGVGPQNLRRLRTAARALEDVIHEISPT